MLRTVLFHFPQATGPKDIRPRRQPTPPPSPPAILGWQSPGHVRRGVSAKTAQAPYFTPAGFMYFARNASILVYCSTLLAK
jgi:hypothetical protein